MIEATVHRECEDAQIHSQQQACRAMDPRHFLLLVAAGNSLIRLSFLLSIDLDTIDGVRIATFFCVRVVTCVVQSAAAAPLFEERLL